jgi:hypothetical protein
MRLAFSTGAVFAVLAPIAASAQEIVQWTAPVAATERTAFFPMGTPVQLTTRTELNTKEVHSGDRFYLEVAEPVVYRGQVVIPVGAVAVGEVMRAERNGHFGKRGKIDIRLNYVHTPNGPVRLSGHAGRQGTGQGLLAIGGAVVLWAPIMLVIHGTSGRVPANTPMTAYLADDLRFRVEASAVQAELAVPDATGQRPTATRLEAATYTSARN